MRLEDMEAYQGIKKFFTYKGAMIALTFQCQFRCEHCGVVYYQKKDKQELSTAEVKTKILDRLKSCGIDVAYFFGGEPTLHKDLVELIQYATDKGLYTRFDSNGYKLADQDYVQRIKDAGISSVLVSIDSADPQIHDGFTKTTGSWERAVQGIKHCLKLGVSVGISTVVTPRGLKDGDFQKVIQLGKDLGVYKIRVVTPVMCGRWIKQGIELSREEKEKFLSLLEPNFVFWEDCCDGTVPFVCCSIVRWFMFISAYGDVQPCCYIPIRFGNIRKQDLKSIIDQMWQTSFFKVDKEVINVRDCPMNIGKIRDKILQLARRQGGFPVDYAEELFKQG